MITSARRLCLVVFLVCILTGANLPSGMFRVWGQAAEKSVSIKEELKETDPLAIQKKEAAVYGQKEFMDSLAQGAITAAPIDPHYKIGPKDTIIINVWGKKNQRFVPEVDEEGFVSFLVGTETLRFSVNGVIFKNLKQKITAELSEFTGFIDLKHPESSDTLVDVTLGKIRGINVTVMGEVNEPGLIVLNTTVSSVFDALKAAKGVTPNASFREMRINRPDGTSDNVDIYEIMLTDELDWDKYYLRDGDLLRVPHKRRSVTIIGEVKKPGEFELKEDEALGDLIELVGGLTPMGDSTKLNLLRILGTEGGEYKNLDLSEQKDFQLMDGDTIEVVAKPETRRMNVVEIIGDGVRQPGVYEHLADMTLQGLVDMAGGLHEDALTSDVLLWRTDREFNRRIWHINLNEKISLGPSSEGHTASTFPLQRLDKLIVQSKFEMEGGDKYVTIKGHVKEAGSYLLSEQMTLLDLLDMAGGFGDEDFLEKTYLEAGHIIRKQAGTEVSIPFHLGKLLEESGGEENRELESEDEILVYSLEEIEGVRKVSISGHVKKPDSYNLRKDMRVSDLLFLGGGFQDPEYLIETYLERAELIRMDPLTRRKTIEPVNLRKVLEGDQSENKTLQSMDHLIVHASDEFADRRVVSVQGEVRSPGEYELTEKMTLLDLVSLANGLTEMADRERIEIARFPEKGSAGSESAKLLVVALGDMGGGAEPVRLQSGDRIVVRKKAELREKSTVQVSGQVAYPGPYVLLSRTETISDIIARAGGFIQGAAPEAAKLHRKTAEAGARPGSEGAAPGLASQTNPAIGTGDEESDKGTVSISIDLEKALRDKKGPYDLPLMDGDEIEIPLRNYMVEVRGEVLFPGAVQFVQGKPVSFYVDYVGGYTKKARKGATVVVYPNGEVKQARRCLFFSAKVRPGSAILAPSKDDVRPGDAAEKAAEEEGLYPSPFLTPEMAGERQEFPEDRMDHPALMRYPDNPDLPRVLLIGDSVSVGYTLPVRNLLKGKANVRRIPVTQTGSLSEALAQLDNWLGEEKWDVIHFNITNQTLRPYLGTPAAAPGTSAKASSTELERDMRRFAGRLGDTGARLIWATSTPLPSGADENEKRNADFNRTLFLTLIESAGNVAVDDLYREATASGRILQYPDDAHFTPEGYEFLAEKVAAAVEAELATVAGAIQTGQPSLQLKSVKSIKGN